MNVLSTLPFLNIKRIVPKQIQSIQWGDRFQILNKNVNLFCWKRQPKQEISSYLESILKFEVPALKFTASIDTLASKLSKSRSFWDPLHLENADGFWIDVYHVTQDFIKLTEKSEVTVHIRVISDNGCTKFHTDGYHLRLLTTYIGPGTEWLPENATSRKSLGYQNKNIVKHPLQIRRMNSFEVGILKGEAPNRIQTLPGIVHRSPEISKVGVKRIVLRVDI